MKRITIYFLLIIIILILLYIIYENSKKKEGFIAKYYRPHIRRLRKFTHDYIFRYIK
jgi:hypothetical protein